MKALSIIALLVGLAGCTQAVRLDPVTVAAPPLALPTVQPLVMNTVTFGMSGTLYTLDADNLQNLNLNLIDIKRYILEQKAVLDLLKTAYGQQTSTH